MAETGITLDGPFFRADPGKRLRGNVRELMVALAEELEVEVAAEMAIHAGQMPFYTGWTHGRVRGRAEGLDGRPWGTWVRVSEYTADLGAKDAKRTMAALAGRKNAVGSDGRNIGTTRGIEGQFHPYRKVSSAVYRARALLTADLTRGLD